MNKRESAELSVLLHIGHIISDLIDIVLANISFVTVLFCFLYVTTKNHDRGGVSLNVIKKL